MEEVTQSIMEDLLQEDEFKKLWVDLAVEIENKIQTKHFSVKTVHSSVPNLPTSYQSTSNFHLNEPKIDATFAKIYKEMAFGLDLVIKNFVRGVHLAYFSDDKTQQQSNYFRYEASSLYSIQVILERSIISNKFNIAQFGLISRRIIKIQQLFGVYTSIPYNVENCTFLATTLYTIHKRFFDYGKFYEPECTRCEEAKKLESVIERFGKIVCLRLEKMLFSLLNKQKISPKSQPFVNFIRNEFCGSKSSDTQKLLTRFQDWSPTHRKGFLLSPELEYSKTRMALAKIQRSNSIGVRGPRQSHPPIVERR
uniref:Uncharacterized protein n=1 Tax=Meloidogyne enterolobii TaxID=390850 RepID=A0A6V7UKU8_MELEN|nr:unnamed protein product [Meloidogyne enterolobii]